MQTTTVNNIKTILAALGVFIITVILSLYLEESYRRLVRFSFKFFNGEHIQFFGKNFHLFASLNFIITSGLFASLAYLTLLNTSTISTFKRLLLTIVIFFTATFLITAVDSNRLIIECTSCDDGIRKMHYNELAYDRYFIISIAITSAYLLGNYFLDRRQSRQSK